MVQDDRLLRRTADGPSEQVLDIVVQSVIALELDRIEVLCDYSSAFLFFYPLAEGMGNAIRDRGGTEARSLAISVAYFGLAIWLVHSWGSAAQS